MLTGLRLAVCVAGKALIRLWMSPNSQKNNERKCHHRGLCREKTIWKTFRKSLHGRTDQRPRQRQQTPQGHCGSVGEDHPSHDRLLADGADSVTPRQTLDRS